jgi:hypothetical protein
MRANYLLRLVNASKSISVKTPPMMTPPLISPSALISFEKMKILAGSFFARNVTPSWQGD